VKKGVWGRKDALPRPVTNADQGEEGHPGSVSFFFWSCGDTAHLHKKVLSEVVFGESHPAVRTPVVLDLLILISFSLFKAEADERKKNPQVG
jgi:hypothetical protein